MSEIFYFYNWKTMYEFSSESDNREKIITGLDQMKKE